MRVILLNMVLGSVSLLVVSAVCGIRLPEGCAVANRLPTRVFGICGRGPKLALGRSPHLEEAQSGFEEGECSFEGRRCTWARHAERGTERQPRREPICSMGLSWHVICRKPSRTTVSSLEARGKEQVSQRIKDLPHGPISRLAMVLRT